MTTDPLPDGWTLPEVTDLNRSWFESGTLAIQRCADCGVRQHPPEELCHRCGAMEFDVDVLAPTGTLHSYTVVHHPVHPMLADAVPYVVALVRLDEDPQIRVVGNLLEVDPADVAIGLPVRAVWVERSDTESTVRVPQWVPA